MSFKFDSMCSSKLQKSKIIETIEEIAEKVDEKSYEYIAIKRLMRYFLELKPAKEKELSLIGFFNLFTTENKDEFKYRFVYETEKRIIASDVYSLIQTKVPYSREEKMMLNGRIISNEIETNINDFLRFSKINNLGELEMKEFKVGNFKKEIVKDFFQEEENSMIIDGSHFKIKFLDRFYSNVENPMYCVKKISNGNVLKMTGKFKEFEIEYLLMEMVVN